jgi:hypothetical protein
MEGVTASLINFDEGRGREASSNGRTGGFMTANTKTIKNKKK